MAEANRVASPASTGGAGTFFEQHVNAYWLAQLLVGGVPPILRDCTMAEVHFQTEGLGWNTDDFLVVGKTAAGDRRHLAGQVKRTFTVSATDDECRKAMLDFWKDFKNSQQFSSATDGLALVVLRGTNTLLEHFSGLLDCARAARDAADFERRLGNISKTSARYCNEIRTIIDESEGRNVTTAELWPFLRVLHVLSLDLHSATCQAEAMIKTLLAHTTAEQDPIGAAEATWNALLREVGEGMPTARSYTRGDIPQELRERHSPIGGHERRALRALNEHSAIIMDGIRSTIGSDLHLGRGRFVQQVIEQMEPAQVVLISGAAGSGKSGIAKDAIEILATDHFAFSFRAEEFAHAHFDGTLQSLQIPVSAKTLGAILAGQGRKVMLIESVERLLEASTRDAFTDLLALVAKDGSWRLVLTCRDYSADLVRDCFLRSAGVRHSVVTVPLLDDEELGEVAAAYPALSHPLANASLRQLLRNPYILDKALQISWSEDQPLPHSEREFRSLFWQQIVRANQHAGSGMPRRREDAFVQVALRRAQALTLYAECRDLDPEVVEQLRHDSLIVSSPQTDKLLAPAHDVLEDWAILHWIDELYAIHQGSITELSAAIGTHPAVRRTYRKWVSELMERDPSAADSLLEAAVGDAGLPAQYRDDTLVSLLQSSSSSAFLERHISQLFAGDKQLLKRVIHLLRVGCVTTPVWLEQTVAHGSYLHVPDGPAWGCILRLVQANLERFDDDRSLLLGFIEDWARGVSWHSPYPDGYESVAAIAHWLLPSVDDYRSKDQRQRVLHVIAKIPNGDPQQFMSLLLGRGGDKRDRAARDFREIVLQGVEGMPTARDVPDLLVSATNDYLLLSESNLQRQGVFGSSLGVEAIFGIKESRHHGYFPASAFQGPFLQLLRHHPRKGLDLILAVLNHSAEWYAHPRVPPRYVELPEEMVLGFGDATSKTQWCNARLWNLYRGTSVGPYVLQSMLMALEKYLLELADIRPHRLEAICMNILRRSDSAAVSAVVASIATAFPHSAGETLLVFLRSPLCILLDRQRLAMESQSPSRAFGILPQLKAENKIHEEERKDSDALLHRRQDLEAAILNLQMGPLAPRVHEILDFHRSDTPPLDEQGEGDRIWRLALHRMDVRQYAVTEHMPESPAATEDRTQLDEGHRLLRFDLKPPDPDVKAMVEDSARDLQARDSRLSLWMWGHKVYSREDSKTFDPSQWRQRLEEARAVVDKSVGEEQDLGRDGPGVVAAVCVRDHWHEMSIEERDWCSQVVCLEVERTADQWNQTARVQRYSMCADRPSAWVLPLLLGKLQSDTQRLQVLRMIMIALTHAVDEVRWYAASGVGRNLWTIDRVLTLRYVNALAMEATQVQQAADAERTRPYRDRRQIDAIEAEAAAFVRERFSEATGVADDAYQSLDTNSWFGAEANGRILTILGQSPTTPMAIAAFERLGGMLVAWWDEHDNHSRDERQERSHDTESALKDLLQNFILRTSLAAASTILQPILEAVDRHPEQIHWIIQALIGLEDIQPNTAQFWSIWQLFADRIRQASWLTGIDREHARGDTMMSAIFLGSWWKSDVRHWRSLEGHAEQIHALFQDLPASSTVLDKYVRFLYHIGEQSLPGAFVRIAKRLKEGQPDQMLRKGNTVFMLEALLQRFVYGKPLELKRQSDLREAVLTLLDILVENGSSAAYKMRDDFVTPAPLN